MLCQKSDLHEHISVLYFMHYKTYWTSKHYTSIELALPKYISDEVKTIITSVPKAVGIVMYRRNTKVAWKQSCRKVDQPSVSLLPFISELYENCCLTSLSQ